MKITPATNADWDSIRNLLTAAALPTDDLGPAALDSFLVAHMDSHRDEISGAVGLERFGAVGLLRSLVVSAHARRQGLGARLVAALEEEAAKSAIESLYLITIDADRYFRNFGYTVVERAETPPEIRATREYSELCPDDAIVMCKDLQ